MPKGFRDMKRELENKQQQGESNQSQNQWNLSPATLEAYAENKRKVDAGLLPKYIGGTADPSNPEVETQAETMYRFTHILGNRKSRNEY
jgi:hypothetical protein